MAAVDPAAIDLIIVANVDAGFHFSEYRLPHPGKLGNKGATAFDVQAVCAGFAYALAIADKFIASAAIARPW